MEEMEGIEKIIETAQHSMFRRIGQGNLTHTQMHDAYDIWMESYDAHKKLYGSLKHLRGIEYLYKVKERVEWRMAQVYNKYPQLEQIRLEKED